VEAGLLIVAVLDGSSDDRPFPTKPFSVANPTWSLDAINSPSFIRINQIPFSLAMIARDAFVAALFQFFSRFDFREHFLVSHKYFP
jgi:hypothetical protein